MKKEIDLSWQSECTYDIAETLNSMYRVTPPSVAIDTETSGLDHHKDTIVGVVLSWVETDAIYLPINHKDDPNNVDSLTLNKALNDYDKSYNPLWLMWNAKFDLRFLARFGFTPQRWFDVSILWYNLRLHESHLIGSLKKASKHILGLDMLELKDLFKLYDKTLKSHDFGVLPIDNRLLSYACADADITLRLYNEGLRELETRSDKENITRLIMSDHELVKPVMRMEDNGLPLDQVKCEELFQTLTKDISAITQRLKECAGYKEFNPASPRQIAWLLFTKFGFKPLEKTKGGEPSTSTPVLKNLARLKNPYVPVIKEILHLRELQALIRYVDKLRGGVNPKTGRVHPQYHLCRQKTGRLSTTGDGVYLKRFNFQGVPKRGKDDKYNIRKLFVAPPGFCWVSVDLSNAEIRLIANFSKDEVLIRTLNKGGDMHGLTCKRLFGKNESDSDWGKWRQIAKICNFGMAYSFSGFATRAKIKSETGTFFSDTKMAHLFKAFFGDLYEGWGNYKRHLVSKSRKECATTTLMGRRRSLIPEYRGKGDLYYGCNGDRIGLNHPIQGSMADLLRRAMVYIDQFILEYNIAHKVQMVSTVHDELNFFVDTEEEAFVHWVIREILKIVEYTPKGFVVPMKAEASVGLSWGNLEGYEFT